MVGALSGGIGPRRDSSVPAMHVYGGEDNDGDSDGAMTLTCKVGDITVDVRTTVLKDADGNLIYKNGRTPVYPMLYAQVTRKLRGVDIYVGAENLTNFRQKDVILGTKGADGFVNPRLQSFDASAIWGPLMGIKAHVGLRFTLWKKA